MYTSTKVKQPIKKKLKNLLTLKVFKIFASSSLVALVALVAFLFEESSRNDLTWWLVGYVTLFVVVTKLLLMLFVELSKSLNSSFIFSCSLKGSVSSWIWIFCSSNSWLTYSGDSCWPAGTSGKNPPIVWLFLIELFCSSAAIEKNKIWLILIYI